MNQVKLTDSIHFLGINDRRTQLFENLWPLPHGVSYNSYLIVDEKTCLIDTVDRKFTDDYFEKLEAALQGRKVDYVVINHVEPDHSGSLKAVCERHPGIIVVGNKKTFPMIENFYGACGKTHTVADGEHLDLGKHKLSFHTIPMVHWPESMVTYESTSRILFSNDAFGSYGTLDGGMFDDEIDLGFYEQEAMRYFTNIVGKYCAPTRRALAKLQGLAIGQIAPSHGVVWRSHIDWILERYHRWSSHTAEKGVVIIFGSMYGNTEKMADAIARQLAVRGVRNIRIHDASKTHISYIISDIFKYKGVILGSCAYNNEMFPSVEKVIREIEHKEIPDRLLGLFGSYIWNGGGVKNLEKFAQAIQWPVITPSVEEKGAMKRTKYEEAAAMANTMADRLDAFFAQPIPA